MGLYRGVVGLNVRNVAVVFHLHIFHTQLGNVSKTTRQIGTSRLIVMTKVAENYLIVIFNEI